MKKLKLSKSKVSDVKQSKILNFFASSKTLSVHDQEEKKIKQVQDMTINKKTTDCTSIVLGERVCKICLQKSPINESLYCVVCDPSISSASSDIAKQDLDYAQTEIDITKPEVFSENSFSPDVIPSTPSAEYHTNKKSKSKNKYTTSVKRKCNFDHNNKVKKKVHLTQESAIGYQPSCSNISEENKFTTIDKENIVTNVKHNFCGNSTTYKHNYETDVECLLSEQIEINLKNYNCSQETADGNLVSSKKETNTSSSEKKANENMKHDNKPIPQKTIKLDNVDCNDHKKILTSSVLEIDDIPSDFFQDLSFDDNDLKQTLCLNNNVRCKVMSRDNLLSSNEIVFALKPCNIPNFEGSITCVLRGSWINSSVSPGDIVNVSAKPMDGQDGCWVVDDDFGLFVIHPDTLVSGTSVVGSLFCMRRAVLSDLYRGIDSESPIMAIGSFLHQLLQEVLKRKVTSLDGIKEVFNEFISSNDFIYSLYSSRMSLKETKENLFQFIPKIYAFIQKYIPMNSKSSNCNSWNDKESWSGKIVDVADIEENIWSPRLGIKGKVDVTVKTLAQSNQSVMPLELKTGRASFSAEHRGQVILYTMMMSELGENVNSGLLLYLRENVMKEVKVGAAERRDLMMLRNQLVTELQASHKVVFASNDQISAPVLPQPIHHHSACAKCPYLTICSAALRVNGTSELPESNPLHKLYETSTSHLQLENIMYVFHWTGLLRLEHTESCLTSGSQDIWSMSPALRMQRGNCLANTSLSNDVVEVTPGRYQHTFTWSTSENSASIFSEGDYVIVSSDTRPAVAAGPIKLVSSSKLSIYLERDLSRHKNTENVWHIDKYESQSGLVFNMTTLGLLLDDTEQAYRLRKAVIDLELPDFCKKLSGRVLKASEDLMAHLNKQQCRAIFRALSAEQYILIKGMPGTGKTATIVALVELAVRLGLSVLITSHTHSAVDNVLLRLRGRVDFLRLGPLNRIHPELTDYGDKRDFTCPDQIHEYYNNKRVVAVTCLGSSHPLLARRLFDLCLVDEATQVLQPTILRPLFSSRKFILIGDPNQLPPLVKSRKAKELGLRQSLFERLDRPAVTSELSLQYRMNEKITDLANTLTYAGRLQCASATIASATLSVPKSLDEEELPQWKRKVVSTSLAMAVVVLDTGITEAVNCTNNFEANIVCQVLSALKKAGLSENKVGVIAPYRAQVELLQKLTSDSQVEVNTVDQYQGRDKDVILYSCTRSSKPTETDILGDKNRLTVAITRARHKLIIIGNVSLLRGYSLFNTLFQSLSSDCISSIS